MVEVVCRSKQNLVYLHLILTMCTRILAFAASMFINSHFINTTSSLSSEQTNGLYVFPPGSVKVGQDNVITVIQVRRVAHIVSVVDGCVGL